MSNYFFSSGNKRYIFVLALFLVTTNVAHAKEKIPDQFRIALGSYAVVRYDSVMSLTDPDLGAGLSITPEDTLGLKTEQSVLRLDGYYRFTRTHALTYSWYKISSDGNKKIEEEFDWIDENGNKITVPVGAKVDTSLQYDIFKLGYLWSFYHTDKVAMSAGVGLHVARIAIGLRTDTTATGVEAKDVDTSLPLPVISFSIVYHVTPRFYWHLKQEFFALNYDKWDGNYTDSTLGIEYRVFENVGLGIALSSNSLKLTEIEDDYKFHYDNRITGVLLNVAAYF